MKKISILAILAITIFPVFAEESIKDVANDLQAQQISDEIAAEPAEINKKTQHEANPDIKFPRGLQFGLGASATSGLNGFVGYANKKFDSFWWKRLGVRFDFATTSPIKSSINSAIDSALSDGVEIGDGLTIGSGQLSAKHLAALVDFYPFGDTWFLGGWRLTGGYMTGNMDLSANLTGKMEGLPEDSVQFELDGRHYKYSGNSIHGKTGVNWKYSGPYLGTGFDLGLFWGIKIYMDAGAVFTSKTAEMNLDVPLAGLETSPNGISGWTPVNPSSAEEAAFNIAKQNALNEANEELQKLKIYPMVKLGFMYRF
ncbi:MAG: hypothetical protein LBD50_01660 [Rickettsiales bacterium]|jgi:hypothetical protein|nr:hypothetical protein [Rickettsiales bacterium]